MTASEDEVFEPVSSVVVEQLAAYKKLLNGEFKIDYNRATRIANENGYVGKNMTIELFYDNKGDINSNTSFYWAVDAHKTDESREILRIDPNNGKVETTSIVIKYIVCT
jgi:DNA segregation ATPase FtsK/SpoIIIE-like protein